MKKTSKQNVSANERLARVVERCGPVLLPNALIESNPPEMMLTIKFPVVITTLSRTDTLDLPNTALQLRWL